MLEVFSVCGNAVQTSIIWSHYEGKLSELLQNWQISKVEKFSYFQAAVDLIFLKWKRSSTKKAEVKFENLKSFLPLFLK